MLRIAVVEDEQEYAQTILKYCRKYSALRQEETAADLFNNPVTFLDKYRGGYDLILMDILMPEMNGMDCARRLRKRDENVMLCFVTNMAQYAIQGYEVGAVDFIIKPVNFAEFTLKLDRMLRLLKRQASPTVMVSTKNAMVNLDLRDLYFVEVYNHNLIYHTRRGDYEAYGKLSSLEEDSRFSRFIRVSPSHLVNCALVSSVLDDCLIVNEVRIPISRRRRKECLEKMASILGGVCY